jgi:hypothetical protein
MYNSIQNIEGLKEHFHNSKDMWSDNVYVRTELRNEWLLENESLTIHGVAYNITFKDVGGGLWLGTIIKVDRK